MIDILEYELKCLDHPTYSIEGVHYQWDLDGINDFLKFLGNPQKDYPVIHITGTNGKGTVSALIASALIKLGYKVGTYNSPHIFCYRDRVKVNGVPISQTITNEFCDIYREYKNANFSQIKSYSELFVALSYWFFSKTKVDVAVIEVGIGGEKDPTNIDTNKILTILTSIGLDHTELFGRSIKNIIKHKIGICRPGIPLLIGELNTDYLNLLRNEINPQTPIKSYLDFNIPDDLIIKCCDLCDFSGPYKSINITIALSALCLISHALGFGMDDERMIKGIGEARNLFNHRGRWDVLSECPLVIADVCGNAFGLSKSFRLLEEMSYENNKNLVIILGISSCRKSDILRILPTNATLILTESHSFITASEVKELYCRDAIVTQSVSEAINLYKKMSNPNDIVFIGGCYWVGVDAILNESLIRDKGSSNQLKSL